MKKLQEFSERHPILDNKLIGLQNQFHDVIMSSGQKIGVASDLMHQLVTPKRLLLLGPPVGIGLVWALGAAEGWMISHDPGYAATYGLANIGRSITWTRQAAETVALAYGVDPNMLIKSQIDALNGITPTQEAAVTKITMDLLLDIRGAIASGTIMTTLISGATLLSRGGENIRNRIVEGVETIRRNQEQLFFLGGEQSGVLIAAMLENLSGVLPIVEKMDAVSDIAGFASHNLNRSFYLNTKGEQYDNKTLWRILKFRKSWLTKTNDGKKKFLILAGDGSVYEEAIDLHDQQRQDLEVRELQLAAQAIQQRATESGIKPEDYQTITIQIGNARLKRPSASGEFSRSERQLSDIYKSVDIWTDTRAPLVEAINNWLGERKELVFDTLNQEYYRNLSTLMKDFNVKVWDPLDPKAPKDTPILVYEETTAYTVTKAKNIAVERNLKGENATRMIATLTDTIYGHYDTELSGLTSICSAKIYKDEVFAIRKQLKEGLTPEVIQQSLDDRWHSPGLEIAPTSHV